MAEPGRLGPYELLCEIGRGGMGVVHRARDTRLGRDVAVKVLGAGEEASPTMIARFLREARAAAQLGVHPNVVAVLDVGGEDGARPYIVMDLVEGPSLDTLVDEGQVPPARAAEIARKVALGVAHAHARGVLHRDLKPSNVLVGADGEPRLTDFGLARFLEDPRGLTRSGTPVGTPHYMSPEQATGSLDLVDARSDVYGLGALLYDLLTGRPPHDGPTTTEVLRRAVADDPAPPRRLRPEVAKDLDTICLKALEKDPGRRYPSAGALAEDLGRFLRGEPIAARRAGMPERLARRVRRNPAPWAVGAVLGGALLAGGAALAVRGVTARADAGRDFEIGEALARSDPAAALERFAAAAARFPEWPGLPEATEAARARAAAAGRTARERDVTLLLEKGEAARARFAGAGEPLAREAAWQQAWGFHLAARETALASGLAEAARAPSERLSDLAWGRLREAGGEGRTRDAARYEALLREYGAERYAREIEGAGMLALETDPPGAEVECRRYREAEPGRLEDAPYDPATGAWPDRPVSLGATPLARVRLPRGSYLLVLRREGFRPVRYPVLIERLEEERPQEPVRMLTEAEIGEGWIYVPAGEALLGGDPQVPSEGPRTRAWIGAFLLMEREVTMGEYVAFLQSLLAEGVPPASVQTRCPRNAPATGHFFIPKDGALVARQAIRRLDPAWPALGMSWDDTGAYAHWWSSKQGRRARLPSQEEWERAARGADGRPYPWGEGFRWEWVVGGQSPIHGRETPRPFPPFTARADVSPFGVRDLAGSASEWCDGDESPGIQATRGGAWDSHKPLAFRAAHRHGGPGAVPSVLCGFRLAADLPAR
ncbi:MAG: bifunctional serine/threonine-protein kinase/formylglycine-generating enzyme family protein [Planctomycetales bacterium]|nr:bifunctional serine/threonine-protein kinase/formylglycine-generating enzyme family protein [Planctomycetales bacterium]